MVDHRLLREAIRRMIQEEIDLGKIVFSPGRRDGVPTDEPNTQEEQDIFDALDKWVHDQSELSARALHDDIPELMRDPRYSDFFHPPPAGRPIYRGLNNVSWGKITDKWLTGPANAAALDMLDNNTRDPGRAECDFVVRPSGGWDSWTHELSVAKRFAAQSPQIVGQINLVLVAHPEDNDMKLFDLGDVQRKVPDLMFTRGVDESEVFALGPVRVSGIIWGGDMMG